MPRIIAEQKFLSIPGLWSNGDSCYRVVEYMNRQKIVLINEIDFALAEMGMASYSELRATLISAKDYLVHEHERNTGGAAGRSDALLVRIQLVLDRGRDFSPK